MKPRFVYLLFILFVCILLTLLNGCAGIEASHKLHPASLQIADRTQMAFRVGKCLYDRRTSTFYVMELHRSSIYFFRNKQLINTIGGMGNDNYSFQKLSDIAIDADGNLLTLDLFARQVRKYSPDGNWIADIDVSAFKQPSKFCSTLENDLIIYDAASRELKRISTFSGKEMFSFGKFQVDGASSISASRDFIAVVSDNEEKTALFSGMGLFLKDVPAQLVLDSYQNQFTYSDGALRVSGGDILLPIGWQDSEVSLFSSGLTLLVVRGDTIITVQPSYQRE